MVERSQYILEEIPTRRRGRVESVMMEAVDEVIGLSGAI